MWHNMIRYNMLYIFLLLLLLVLHLSDARSCSTCSFCLVISISLFFAQLNSALLFSLSHLYSSSSSSSYFSSLSILTHFSLSIIALARRTGLPIIADEIYGGCVFDLNVRNYHYIWLPLTTLYYTILYWTELYYGTLKYIATVQYYY